MTGGWRRRLLGPWRRPGAAVPAAPARAAPPAAAPSPAKGGVVAVTVLGLSGEALERVIEIARQQCAAAGTRPVFVTDLPDLEPFRRRRLVADQVVDAEARQATTPDLPWRLYRQRQYALLAARWRPRAVVSFGRQPDDDCVRALGVKPGQ